ncbi:LuxR family transcriptional regulator [Amycolatopsis sp. Hca4]|uniref:helix-turn-helix transcriptional regulator n=1 Tax=Amycolatopsis sp. Hca4 TaxID=2742131 RepID=UPI001591BFD9|nr:LuxR family transcriptional regulator [Amycolatopsis sp. Hca4]QKV73739.1 AAA family ATPase [Amycolatopsis sp. Hca4]
MTSDDDSFDISEWPEDAWDIPCGLTGRDGELRTIAHCAKAAISGQPALVHLEGEPGMGRSALARAAVDHLPGFLVVWIACHESERDVGFGGTDQAISGLRRVAATRGVAIPRLDSPEPRPAATGRSLLTLLDGIQRVHPAAIVLDDAHWCDEQSLQSFGFLVRRLRVGRVLLIVTSAVRGRSALAVAGPAPSAGSRVRPHLEAAALDALTVRLGALPDEQVLALARNDGRPVDARLAERLTRFSGGNPRVANLLIDGAELDHDASGAVLPPSLVAALEIQLAGLPAHARTMLDALAVLGSPARITQVAQLAGFTDHVAALEVLLGRGLLTWAPRDLPSVLEIPDPLLADGVYQLLRPSRRRELHAAAAELVADARRWRHRRAATIGVSPTLAAELESQASAAVLDGRIEQAVEYLRWAADLSSAKEDHQRAVLTGAVLDVWWERGSLDEAERTVRGTDPGPVRDAALGVVLARRPDGPAEADALLRGCLPALVEGGVVPGWLALLTASALARVQLLLGRADEAVRHARFVLDHADQADRTVLVRTARTLVFAVLHRDGPGTALAVLEHTDAELRGAGGLGAGRVFDFDRATLLLLNGKLTEAAVRAEAALEVTTHPAGDTVHHGATLVLAEAQFRLGGWARASEAVETALRMDRDGSLPTGAGAAALVQAARLAAVCGRWKRAAHHIGRIEQVPGVRREHRLMYLTIARAAVAGARGDHALVIALFAETAHLFAGESAGRLPWVVEQSWRPLLAEALVEAAAPESAQAELVRLGRLAEQAGYLRTTQLWLAGRLAERAGDPQRARWFFEQAITRPADHDSDALGRAQAELAYGLLRHRRGEGRAASVWLRRARQRLVRLDAAPFVERCDQALAAITEAPLLRFAELTERERQVAALVNENLTNNQIAATLFVSEKTVEYHLGKVFAKLGISSRRQLRGMGPAVIGPDGGPPRPPRP